MNHSVTLFKEGLSEERRELCALGHTKGKTVKNIRKSGQIACFLQAICSKYERITHIVHNRSSVKSDVSESLIIALKNERF